MEDAARFVRASPVSRGPEIRQDLTIDIPRVGLPRRTPVNAGAHGELPEEDRNHGRQLHEQPHRRSAVDLGRHVQARPQRARADAFGVNVLDIGPDYTTTDHTEDASGQEELYLVLHGSATLPGRQPAGEEEAIALEPEVVARIAPEARRLFRTGPEARASSSSAARRARPTSRRTGRAASSDRRDAAFAAALQTATGVCGNAGSDPQRCGSDPARAATPVPAPASHRAGAAARSPP